MIRALVLLAAIAAGCGGGDEREQVTACVQPAAQETEPCEWTTAR